MFHGFGSCMPSSVAKRTDLGRHTFDTLKGPSQLGRACGAPLGSGFTIGLGSRPGAPYYARTVDSNAPSLAGSSNLFRKPVVSCISDRCSPSSLVDEVYILATPPLLQFLIEGLDS
jgi:hypothetical protein